MRYHVIFAFFLLASCATLSSFADDKSAAAADAAQAQGDLRQFHDWLYRFGARPSDGAVARTVARARANPEDVRWLFWTGKFGVDGRVKDFDWVDGLRRAVEKEYPPAMALYGTLLCEGSSLVTRDVPRGVELIRRAAVKGDMLATSQLGLVYSIGLPGVRPDLERAEVLAQRAVDHGMLRGLVVLANTYQARGDGQKALQYVTQASDAGDPEAMRMLVEAYLFGRTPDLTKAVELFQRGALMSEPSLLEQYAMALELELAGLKQDRVLSRHMLRRAISMGNRTAEADWAYGQVTGAFGIAPAEKTGLATLQRLADANVSDAQLLLARLLLKGEHVNQDRPAAIVLMRTAARLGNKRALRVLEQEGVALEEQ
ncbi:MAG TPA: tetratricopeptide repeat protein [Tepidisphaeraceae bacterium]|jgi:TPR repeat protein